MMQCSRSPAGCTSYSEVTGTGTTAHGSITRPTGTPEMTKDKMKDRVPVPVERIAGHKVLLDSDLTVTMVNRFS